MLLRAPNIRASDEIQAEITAFKMWVETVAQKQKAVKPV
jgi:hypothetical protein